jgi:hypothetical protein
MEWFSVPAPEAAAPTATPLSPADRRRVVYDHIHDSSSELSALQGFYGDSRGLVVKFYEGVATGAAGAITGDVKGADLAEWRKDTP